MLNDAFRDRLSDSRGQHFRRDRQALGPACPAPGCAGSPGLRAAGMKRTSAGAIPGRRAVGSQVSQFCLGRPSSLPDRQSNPMRFPRGERNGMDARVKWPSGSGESLRMEMSRELASVPPHPEVLRAELAEALSLEGRGGRDGGHPRASRLAALAPQHEGGERPAKSMRMHSSSECLSYIAAVCLNRTAAARAMHDDREGEPCLMTFNADATKPPRSGSPRPLMENRFFTPWV